MEAIVRKSTRKDKKYMITLIDSKSSKKIKTIHIGQAGASDYTKHKDPERKENYIARHSVNQDHTKSGVKTSGYWSRYLTWNKPTLEASARDIERRLRSEGLNIKVKLDL